MAEYEYYYLSIDTKKLMLRTNCVIRAFSNLTPHLKAINNTGINSRNIIYNPR